MSMSIRDANDVQALGRWILGTNQTDPDVAELQGDQARAALARLLNRSSTKLEAGQSGDAVTAGWPVPGLPSGTRLHALGGES